MTPEQHEELMSAIADQNKQIGQIKVAVIGDKESGIPGLVSRVEDAENYILAHKLAQSKLAGKVSVIVFIGALVVTILMNLISKHL